MRKIFFALLIQFVIFSVFFVNEIWANSALKDKTVYVWNFDAKDTGSIDLAESVTDEFEQALIKSRECIVLQRRYYKKLFDQRQQEMGIKRLEDFDKESIEIFKSKEADLVIFGEVHDDNASGQIKISAFVQNFDTQILASESVYGPRSLKLDPERRMEYVIQLLDKFISSGGSQPTPGTIDPDPLPKSETVSNYRITLTEIVLNGTNLEFNFEVINRAQTRKLQIHPSRTVLYDDTGRELKPTNITIGESQNEKTLVPGVPVNMKFFFQGVFDDVIWIPQLKATFFEKNRTYHLIFYDLKIPR